MVMDDSKIIGNQYGEFKVIGKLNGRYYDCVCASGHHKKIRKDHLGKSLVCQQCKTLKEHVGDTINGLTFLKYLYSDKYYNKYYLIRCFCGKEFVSVYSAINSGHTKSCGCLWNKYGDLSKDPRYNNWEAMVQRTTNKNHKAYDHYHSLIKGTVIERSWVNSPKCFYDDIGEKPSPEYTIDRIDNSLGYVRGNVKWSTKTDQQLNRSTARGISGKKYIYYDKRRHKYVAYVYIPGGRHYIGQYDTLDKAILAQDKFVK